MKLKKYNLYRVSRTSNVIIVYHSVYEEVKLEIIPVSALPFAYDAKFNSSR